MALTVPSLKNPFDPANPTANAYVVFAGQALDFLQASGGLTLNVYPSSAAYQGGAPPLWQFKTFLGSVAPSTPVSSPGATAFHSFAQLVADTSSIGTGSLTGGGFTFSDAFKGIIGRFEKDLIAYHPLLSNASVVA